MKLSQDRGMVEMILTTVQVFNREEELQLQGVTSCKELKTRLKAKIQSIGVLFRQLRCNRVYSRV
jgi:hypothetical protein